MKKPKKVARRNPVSKSAPEPAFPEQRWSPPPTQFELAQIAATLADHQPIGQDPCRALVRCAYGLWEAAWLELRDYDKKMKSLREKWEEKRALLRSMPAPKRFPVSLDEFLRLVIGGKSGPDRMKLFRDYLRSPRDPDDSEPRSDGQVEAALAGWRQRGFTEGQFYGMAVQVQRWRENRNRQ